MQYIFNIPWKPKGGYISGRSDLDCFDRPHKPVSLKTRIFKFWNQHSLGHMLNLKEEHCMACGRNDTLDAAHILAKCYSGSNYENNLHCLCKPCHMESETLQGINYWLWIGIKSKLFKNGTDLTTERDTLPSGELYDFPYEAEYIDKLKTYHKEYAILSRYQKWIYSYAQCEQILSNRFNLKIKFGDVSILSLIDEYTAKEKPRKIKDWLRILEGKTIEEQGKLVYNYYGGEEE